MKRVFIHAYAAGNLGDDLLIRILCERYPKTRFVICADSSYKKRYADLKNLRVFSPDDKLVRYTDRILKRIKHCDNGMWKLLLKSSCAAVHIGGSVFVQHQDDFTPAYHLDCQLRNLSRRLYVVGANFGPYTDENYYHLYKRLLSSYEGVCFRDKYSKKLFKDLPNVRYAPDVVFNYRQTEKTATKKQVLFSVVYLDNRGGKYSISQYAEEYYNLMAGMAEQCIERDYTVKFVSFCRMQEDEKAVRIIIDRMDEKYKKAVSTFFYDMDEKECVSQFFESELVVGTRFHSIILGWLAEKRVLPVVYDRKTLHTLEDLGVEDYILLEDLEKIHAEEAVENLTGRDVMDVKELKNKAGLQFADLDRLLR